MTGPRPMTTAERDAFTMHTEGTSIATIQKTTGLRPAQIAAAVDLARLHAQLALQPAEPPAIAPARTRQRLAAPHDLVEKNRVLTALVDTLREQLAKYETELAELHANPAAPGAAQEPEHSRAPDAVPDLAESEQVRDWAVAEGWQVPNGPRLPGGIVAAYIRAHGGTQ